MKNSTKDVLFGIVIGLALMLMLVIVTDITRNYLNSNEEEIGKTIHSSNSLITSERIQTELGKLFDELIDMDDLNCDTRYQHQSQDNKTAFDFIQCKFDDGTKLKCEWNTYLNRGSFNCDWSDLP